MRPFKFWLLSFLAIALFAIISVLVLDAPIALAVRDLFGRRQIPADLATSPVLSVPLISATLFVLCGLAALMGRRFSKLETAILLCNIGILAADAIKNQLKFAFGRTWPDSWGPNVASLVHDNLYAFNYFHGGESLGAFPSGHAAVTAAIMSVLWVLYPKLRVLWGAAVIVASAGLVALNLHFLSDVVVGSFVGASAGLFTVALWQTGWRAP